MQCIHVGPYHELGATYEAMAAWIAERGHEHAAAPSYEFYLNDPQDTPAAELWTRVVMPVT